MSKRSSQGSSKTHKDETMDFSQSDFIKMALRDAHRVVQTAPSNCQEYKEAMRLLVKYGGYGKPESETESTGQSDEDESGMSLPAVAAVSKKTKQDKAAREIEELGIVNAIAKPQGKKRARVESDVSMEPPVTAALLTKSNTLPDASVVNLGASTSFGGHSGFQALSGTVAAVSPPESSSGSSTHGGKQITKVIRKKYASKVPENSNNIPLYELSFGDGYWVRLSKYKSNGQPYVSIGRHQKIGVSMSTMYLGAVERSARDLRKLFSQFQYDCEDVAEDEEQDV